MSVGEVRGRLESSLVLRVLVWLVWIGVPWGLARVRTGVGWQWPRGWAGEGLLAVVVAVLGPGLLWLGYRYGCALMTESSANGESGCLLQLVLPVVVGFSIWALVGPWMASAPDVHAFLAPLGWATFANSMGFAFLAQTRGGV